MRHVIARIALFILTFAGGVFLFNTLLSRGAGDTTYEMSSATLPLIYTRVDGENVNCMHGYTTDIDAALLKDSVTPMDGTDTVNLYIDDSGTGISSLKYEVRSGDGSSLVEDGKASELRTNKQSNETASIKVRMDLDEAQSYILKLILKTTDGKKIDYYTQLVYGENMHADAMVDFATEFHSAILDKDRAESVSKYLETDPSRVSTGLANVDISSSFDTITYNDLKPEELVNPVPQITGISGDVATLKLESTLMTVNSDSQTMYYDVVENFKVRYTSQRMYLLDYTRTMDSLYSPDFTLTGSNALNMGLTSTETVPVMSDEDKQKTAFVKERQLFYYDYQHTLVNRVFSFTEDRVNDLRSSYAYHDIEMIDMDKDGNLTFAVFGYMNRGKHEGANGICLYKYYPVENQVSELAFVESAEPYSILREDLGQALYLNSRGVLYVTLRGTLCRINTKTGSIKEQMKGVKKETAVSSADHSLMSLLDNSDISENEGLTVVNLKNGDSRSQKADSGDVIASAGFVDGDLVCESIHKDDIRVDKNGDTIYPVYRIQIISGDGTPVKEYRPDKGKYISKAEVRGSQVSMKLATVSGSGFHDAGSYYIMSNDEKLNESIDQEFMDFESAGKELCLIFPNSVYINEAPKLSSAKLQADDRLRTISVTDFGGDDDRYYVYGNGSVNGSYESLRESVKAASECNGGVLSGRLKTIWEANAIRDYAIVGDDLPVPKVKSEKDSLAACMYAVLDHEEVSCDLKELENDDRSCPEILSDRLKNHEGLDMTGCSLDQMRYFISTGRPFIAKISSDHYVLVTSYNESLLRYTDPVSGEVVRDEYSKMASSFEDAGNVFYCYTR